MCTCHAHLTQFYFEYLDELNDEYDALRLSGYTGEGFLSQGAKLSTDRINDSARLPLHLARQRALAQAERRQNLQRIMGPPGGQRLGGTAGVGGSPASRIAPDKTPRELSLAAAERRKKDEQQCGHDSFAAEQEAAKAARQAITIDISDDDAELPDAHPQPRASTSRNGAPSGIDTRDQNRSHNRGDDGDEVELVAISRSLSKAAHKRKRSSSPIDQAPHVRSKAVVWTCRICTLENEAQTRRCAACNHLRTGTQQPHSGAEALPRSDADGWTCHNCSHTTQHQWWSCRRCGTIKLSS